MKKEKSTKELKKYCWTKASKYNLKKYPACRVCNQRLSVHVHHIIRRKSNYLFFDDMNLIAICAQCHSKFHPAYRYSARFDDIERVNILTRIIGIEGIEYLESHRHDIKNDIGYEIKEMIIEYNKKIKLEVE